MNSDASLTQHSSHADWLALLGYVTRQHELVFTRALFDVWLKKKKKRTRKKKKPYDAQNNYQEQQQQQRRSTSVTTEILQVG